MAIDTSQYENQYRKYLEDEDDVYQKPSVSLKEKVIMGGIAAVGLAATGNAMIKRGDFSHVIHDTMLKAGQYRKGVVQAANRGVRAFSSDERLDDLGAGIKAGFKGEFSKASEKLTSFREAMEDAVHTIKAPMTEHRKRVAEASTSQLVDSDIALKRQHYERRNIIKDLQENEVASNTIQVAEKEMTDIIIEASRIDEKKAVSQMQQTGFRYATMRDLIDAGEVQQYDKWVVESVASIAKTMKSKSKSQVAADNMKITTEDNLNKVAWNHFLDSKADDNIFIDNAGNLADFRDFKNTFEGAINSLATEFTIPLVKINPLRMFYVDQFFTGKNKPMFHLSFEDQKNPLVVGHNGSQGTKHLYLNGKIKSINEEKVGEDALEDVSGDFFLAPAQTGPIARLLRNMSRISISKFMPPDEYDPIHKRIRYNVQTTMDIGIQDEPMGEFDLLDPTSWVTSLINLGTKHLRMDEYQKMQDGESLRQAFGKNADFIYMRKHRSLEDSDGYKHYLSQFWSGRQNLENVTLSTMFPYGYFERLNATLNQINLGLSNDALADAPTVFGNLLLKRIAPVWAGMELWDYVNYESENLLGTQIEDQFAITYANSSIEAAKLRDNLGLTDWAKGITPLLVGGEQIADIPILGDMLDWNDTAEETEEFWTEGEVAVRKGRWWPLGNTPYTGNNIDYFQPNWVRRTLSDYEFSDSLYGSREEYFQNSWMPTLSHPFAPIRHFVTDPYHYEIANYDSRPYMITGGIPELENFPLIGPVLNATIGQILKPQIAMHTDEWQTSGYVQPVEDALVVPAGDVSAMPVSMGVRGVGVSPAVQSAVEPAIHIGYTTASGATTVMQTDDVGHIYDLVPNLSEQTPVSTGDFKVSRIDAPMAVVEDGTTPTTVASAYSMLGNLHYNMGEMGGFYGFMGFSMTGEIGDTRPVIQSSSDMTGYTRQFWDNDIGGFGGDANEIFRRFVPADRKLNEVNTIENTMPEWLPGSNYFIDFQSGDPYVKVKKGEMRLPGEGYERLYGIDTEDLMAMDIGASFIGYDEQKIRDHLLKNDVIKDETLNHILDKGTDWHVKWEREMVDKGIALSAEQYVKDEEAGIGGFYDVLADHGKAIDWLMDNAVEFTYYQPTEAGGFGAVHNELGGHYFEGTQVDLSSEADREAYKRWAVSQSSTALIDPKTRSKRRYDEDEIHYENMQQVNFYGNQVGTPINYLIHVDRDNPDAGIKVFGFGTSDGLLQESYDKVQGVRDQILTEMENGDLHRGNLYDMIDRYRILADVAPYSQEFRDMKTQLKNMNLTEDEMNEARVINEQVSARKEKIRMYDYRFKNSEVSDELLTVDHIIDNNTFVTKENPDNPITLAGIRVSTSQDSEEAAAASAIISKALREGGKVRVLMDANEDQRVKDNTYRTIDAVIFDQHGRNVNRLLLEEGLAKEKENDYSPAALHARFSQREIAFGSMWESFAHMDTILHTKLLQVRSPIESYERREVYGKDWQEWTDPIDDFLIPFIQNSAMHNPVWAVGVGATIGAMFGSLKTTDVDNEIRVQSKFGKIVGASVGASVMGAAWLNARVHELATGERWIPERRQQERDVEEYFDVLEYVKNNALFNKYASLAMRDEGFDVKEYLRENEKEGEFRQSKRKDLEELKRRLYRSVGKEYNDVVKEIEKQLKVKIKQGEDPMSILNAEIERLSTQREIQKLTPNAAKAMMYKQEAEKTMYGYDAGDPVSNILAALPKKDRDYLMPFIESPVSERERILATVPDYMKRVLQSTWGMEVDEKESLFEYFKDKPLPGANWVGWKEGVTMKDMKVKFVDNAGLDPSEFDIWDKDRQRAEMIEGQAPDVLGNARTDPNEYARKLKEILLGFNVEGVQVNVVQSNVRGINIDMDIEQNRRDDVQSIINQEGYRLF